MTIPAGYRLAVISPTSTVLDTIDLEGYDLTRSTAAWQLGAEVSDVVARDLKA